MQNSTGKKTEDKNSHIRTEETGKIGKAEKATGPAMGNLPLTNKKDDQVNTTDHKTVKKEKAGDV